MRACSHPVVCAGLQCFIEASVSEADSNSSRYYTHFLPEHLQVLRWISDCSPLSRQAILHILDKCFHLPTPILDAEGAVRG